MTPHFGRRMRPPPKLPAACRVSNSGMEQEYGQGNHIRISRALAIPLSEITFQFSRGSGPGGQNINRRETRVEILFDVSSSDSLSEEQRNRLLRRLAKRIDSEGILHIVARSHRSQLRNRQEAMERFVQVLQQGLRAPKRRVRSRPSQQSVERRLARKRRRSETKKLRQRVRPDSSA
jgi:ribosome-associated protein